MAECRIPQNPVELNTKQTEILLSLLLKIDSLLHLTQDNLLTHSTIVLHDALWAACHLLHEAQAMCETNHMVS